MNVKLVLEKGAARAQTFRLRSEETIIGRRLGCDIRIPSEDVSRRHCRLSYREDYLTVEDLASANGTFVNGAKISRLHVLRPGDRLTVGKITFVVKYHLTQAAIDHLLQEDRAAEEEVVEVVEVEEIEEVEIEEVEVELAEEAEDDLAPIPMTEDLPMTVQFDFKDLKAEEAPAKKKKAKESQKGPIVKKEKKEKQEKPAAKKKAADEKAKSNDEEKNPDASSLLGQGGPWQMPAGEEIRDILSQLDKD